MLYLLCDRHSLLHFMAHGLSVYAYNCIAYLRMGTLLRTMPLIPYAYMCSLCRDFSLHRAGSIVCPNGQILIFKVYNFSRAPMFVFEFENALFEFAYARPHIAPLFALPPTISSSTICCLFGQRVRLLSLCAFARLRCR